MNRLVVALFVFALVLIGYAQCVPLSSIEFERRRDENVADLIEKNRLNCQNIRKFCYKGVNIQSKDVSRLACQVILETYLCDGQHY